MVGVVDDDDRNEIQLDEESPDGVVCNLEGEENEASVLIVDGETFPLVSAEIESNGRCDAVVHEKSDNGGLKKLELVEKVAIIAKSSNFSKTFSAEVTSPEEDESGGQILSEDALNRNGSCTAGVHGETENGGSRLELEEKPAKPAILANSSDADNVGSDDIVSSEGIESIEKISESDQSCELRQTAAHVDTFVKEEIQTPETENVTNVISSYANFRNRKCNQLRQTEGSSNVVEKESESESDDEFQKEEAEERLYSDPDGSDDEGAEHSESDVKGSESGEDSEEETRNHNSGLKGSSAKTTSSAKDKSKKVTTEKKETLVKSPKKVPMTNNSKANDSIGESPVVFSRRKKSQETTNKKSFAPSKCSSKENDSMEKSGKKSAKGKDKVKEACAPTDEELRKGNGTALKDIPKGTMDIPLPLDRLSFPSPSSDATTLDAVNRDQTCVVLLATGSFNPPTYMHLRLFELARDALSLDGCYVLGGYMSPVNDAYMKRGLVSAEHRLQLCELACRSSSFVMVDSWEAKQSNYQRTLTVLARISSSVCESKSIPRESLRVMLVCGSDLLESFSIPGVWIREQVRAICRDYGVVCIRREGKDIERVISADDILNEYKNNIKVVDELVPNQISSTRVRECISRRLSIKYLTPDEVIESLQGNGITGEILVEVGNLLNLQNLDLENSRLSGQIPPSLGGLRSLQFLSLSHNNLSGPIPESFAHLPRLIRVQLDSNRLSGQVPAQLFQVPTYNFTGNDLNCGTKFSLLCTSSSNNTGSSNKSKLGIIIGVIGGLIGFVLFGGVLFLLCKGRRKGYKREVFVDVAGEVDRRIAFGQLKRFAWRELQLATDSFSEKNVLGQGGFGKVYKGVLADNTKIAVKRLTDYESPGGEQAFLREVEMISVAVHRNLLRLIGFCTTPSERLLVYPFMQNLSVAYRLREVKPGESVLDWPTRKRVALGTARGLEYLHEHCNPKIIHRDVKAANVLLDEDFEPVVGDFGLAKLVDVRRTNVTTQVRGTMGHIAPEYLSTGKSSERTDVFGYGIMLLEIVTGQRAIDFSRLEEEDDVLLLDHVKKLEREKRLGAIVDRNLTRNYNSQEVEMMIKVALLCTQPSPEDRPTMSDVVRMLEGEGLAERWEEWQQVEINRRQEYERLQMRFDWGEDSIHDQNAIELSGGR